MPMPRSPLFFIRAAATLTAAMTVTLLGGCPAVPICPNCGYRTASFTLKANEVGQVTVAKMHTHIDHPPTSGGDDNCPIIGDPSPCVTDRVDDVLCKISTTSAKQAISLPVQSVDSATHTVNVSIVTPSGSRTAAAAVGDPVKPGDSRESRSICR